MIIVILVLGVLIGILLSVIENKICCSITFYEAFSTVLITVTVFIAVFFRFGITLIFLKAIFLAFILILVSFIDFKLKIIPDKITMVLFLVGILFCLARDNSLISSLLGMIIGGGSLYLAALIPGSIGGGDVKLMFAVGIFLGLKRVLWALFLAFTAAAVISVVLLIFRIKGRKDYIPFGPFLALGSMLSFILII